MPDLPLHHIEPFAAVLGVMLFPALDEKERSRRDGFVADHLARAIKEYENGGGQTLTADVLRQLLFDAIDRPERSELETRWEESTATGEIFKLLFALANTDKRKASWENAIRLAEREAVRSAYPTIGSRSSLRKAKSRFQNVAHLWAALSIRGRGFRQDPAVGYEYRHDFQEFVLEAEYLARWGITWKRPAAKSVPPLKANDLWRAPRDWTLVERQPGWPQSGGIPDIVISEEEMAELRGPGRQRS